MKSATETSQSGCKSASLSHWKPHFSDTAPRSKSTIRSLPRGESGVASGDGCSSSLEPKPCQILADLSEFQLDFGLFLAICLHFGRFVDVSLGLRAGVSFMLRGKASGRSSSSELDEESCRPRGLETQNGPASKG